MTELRVRRREGQSLEPVDDGNPLPVAVIPSEEAFPAGHQPITVSTTAIGLSPTDAAARTALITVEVAPIRYRTDGGTAPTATTGHEALVGAVITLESKREIGNFSAIARDGVSATLRVTYGR